MMAFFDKNSSVACLLAVALLCVMPAANARDTIAQQENSLTNTQAPLATFLPYKKSSFAPLRKEFFTIPIEIKNPQKVKHVLIEIRTADDDLVRVLNLSVFSKDKTQYEIKWDGLDRQKRPVPDEAYIPVLIVTDHSGKVVRFDPRYQSGGEEVYKFEKSIRLGTIEYTLPVASRILIRSGIKNGPMLRTIVDWQPRTAGFHAERWNGRDLDDVIAVEQNPQVGYLIIGYQLPDHSIVTYDNKKETYRAYRERNKWPLIQTDYNDRLLERGGKLIRPESYTPILQQKSPRISVNLLDKASRKPVTEVQGMNEILAEVKLHPLDEVYLDQERYEISFFVDNEFIAEEEQGFVPFTWRWSPGRYDIKPGKHILTVNVSGYRGQVGVRNLAFDVRSNEGAKKETKAALSNTNSRESVDEQN